MKTTARSLWTAMAAGLAGGLLSVWLLTGEEVSAQKTKEHKKVVTAEDFHLVDRDGKLRGALFVSAKGEPGFALFDKDEKSRVLLMLNADGSSLVELLDEAGKSRARMALSKEGRPDLMLAGEPTLLLLDTEQRPLWKAP
ncbi:MAG: hypothetical protein HY282_07755 [Nitrospirae bacterium]|nr:hypothetical protein [Candidatus Manganitrophaceae bacterium]